MMKRVPVVLALIAGPPVAGEWNSWLLFTNGGSFGVKDPQFDTDIGFYVFKLPFLSFVSGWLFAALLIVLIVTAVAHYLNGGIRVSARRAVRLEALGKSPDVRGVGHEPDVTSDLEVRPRDQMFAGRGRGLKFLPDDDQQSQRPQGGHQDGRGPIGQAEVIA